MKYLVFSSEIFITLRYIIFARLVKPADTILSQDIRYHSQK